MLISVCTASAQNLFQFTNIYIFFILVELSFFWCQPFLRFDRLYACRQRLGIDAGNEFIAMTSPNR